MGKLSFKEAAIKEADSLYEMLDQARNQEDWEEIGSVLIELAAFELRVGERIEESDPQRHYRKTTKTAPSLRKV